MTTNWALRWFAMLIVFALSTMAFSSYASAVHSLPPPPITSPPSMGE